MNVELITVQTGYYLYFLEMLYIKILVYTLFQLSFLWVSLSLSACLLEICITVIVNVVNMYLNTANIIKQMPRIIIFHFKNDYLLFFFNDLRDEADHKEY